METSKSIDANLLPPAQEDPEEWQRGREGCVPSNNTAPEDAERWWLPLLEKDNFMIYSCSLCASLELPWDPGFGRPEDQKVKCDLSQRGYEAIRIMSSYICIGMKSALNSSSSPYLGDPQGLVEHFINLMNYFCGWGSRSTVESIPIQPFGVRYLKLEPIPTSKLDRVHLDKQNRSLCYRRSMIVLAADCDNPKKRREAQGRAMHWNDISRWI